MRKSNYFSTNKNMPKYVNTLFFSNGRSISEKMIIRKVIFFIKNQSKITLETSTFEVSKNHRKMMLKWSRNPSQIDEKSIQKSRSEKGRPKIEKNRAVRQKRWLLVRFVRLWGGKKVPNCSVLSYSWPSFWQPDSWNLRSGTPWMNLMAFLMTKHRFCFHFNAIRSKFNQNTSLYLYLK